MKTNYTCILFDVDDTLFDYKRAEHGIMEGIFGRADRKLQDTDYERLWELSWFYWDKYQLSNTQNKDVQKNFHNWYHAHLYDYMEKMQEEFKLEISKETLHDWFIEFFKEQFTPYEDTERVLKTLAKTYLLAAATNGLTDVQKSRLRRYETYVSHIFVSEEMGVCKPESAYWTHIIKTLGIEKEKCLMVGDSLTSDIWGAKQYGIDTCWLNRNRKTAEHIKPKYEITKLEHLLDVV